MPYDIQVSALAKAGNLFSVGSAGLAQAGLAGENAAADHTVTIPAALFINPVGSGYNVLLMALRLSQSGTVASARPEILFSVDLGNRWVSDGGVLTPVNRLAGGRTSAMVVYHSAVAGTAITAAAATAFIKYFDQREFLQVVNAQTDARAQIFDFSGSVVVPPGWTFGVNIRSNGAALFNAHWNLDYYEKAVA